jgi:hypothetical protein
MPNERAPGSDGFSALFLKKYWAEFLFTCAGGGGSHTPKARHASYSRLL